MIGDSNLLLAILAQKFRQSRLRYREMRGPPDSSKFLSCCRMSAHSSDRIYGVPSLVGSLFPRFNGGRFLGGFRSLVLLCALTAENNRGKEQEKLSGGSQYSVVSGPVAQRLEQGTHNLVPLPSDADRHFDTARTVATSNDHSRRW